MPQFLQKDRRVETRRSSCFWHKFLRHPYKVPVPFRISARGRQVAESSHARLSPSSIHTKLQSDRPNGDRLDSDRAARHVWGHFACCRGGSCSSRSSRRLMDTMKSRFGQLYSICFPQQHRHRGSARSELVHGEAWPKPVSKRGIEDEIITIVASQVVLIFLSSVLAWYLGQWAGYF